LFTNQQTDVLNKIGGYFMEESFESPEITPVPQKSKDELYNENPERFEDLMNCLCMDFPILS
jgi:hypothetical protein